MAKKKLLDTEENIETIKEDYLGNCLTIQQLSEKYKCSSAVIQRFLHKHQILKNQRFIPSEEEHLYIRGLFDGDDSMYYKYISGRFEGINWQICTGSEQVVDGIYNTLKSLGIKAYKELCINKQSGNNYWHCTIRSKQEMKILFKYLYNDSQYLCLRVKKARFIKLLNLIEMNKQVDDIVDTPMKIED